MGLDAVVAAAVAVFALLRSPVQSPAVWAVVIGLVVVLPLRRLRPVPVLAAELLAATAAIVVGVPGDPVVFAVAFALYPVAVQAGRTGSVLALGLSLVAAVVPALAVVLAPGLPLVAAGPLEAALWSSSITVVCYSAFVITSAWALGRLVRGRRAAADELIRRRESQAIADERIRIARDLHDVVGHSLSLITMKAAVAEHLAATRPDEARAALAMIEKVGRSALGDVKSALTGLREKDDHAPGLAGIGDLVDTAEAAGLTVVCSRVDLDDLPASIRAAAYRVVQEALTNAVKYARPRRCSLAIDRSDGSLVISMVNPLEDRHRSTGRGHGVIGMKERVAVHGGRLHAAPGDDGRFELRAVIPLSSEVAS